MAFSDYEKFKWESMEHLAHRTGLAGPWAEVRRLADDPAEQTAIVRRFLTEALDQGLIFGAYATYTAAYNLKFTEFTRVPREVIEQEFELDLSRTEDCEGDVDAAELFWIFPTLAGERASLSQPAEAFFHEYTQGDIERRRAFIAELENT